MDYKRLRKVFEYFFTWLALYACSLIFSIIPLKQLYSIAGFLGSFFFRITGKHRKTALNSLEIAFGNEKNAFQRGEIAHGCFTNLTKSVLELISLTNGWPALRKIQVNLVNREVLDKALEKKKGIILVSAHFGNFPLAIGKLLQNGYG
ncbi:MAG: hypothetical protein KKE64_04565, partial [Candidatus Omnitrophica bacterium]|nr:hypothetical protein [Candidatus Omnitrophota bacterium]